MGREARRTRTIQPTTPKRFALPKGDFFELRTLLRDVEVAEHEMRQAAAQHRAKIEGVKKRLLDRFAAIGTEHGFDPKGSWSFDDATHTLIAQETPTTT